MLFQAFIRQLACQIKIKTSFLFYSNKLEGNMVVSKIGGLA